GLLPVRLPGGRGCDRSIPRRPQTVHGRYSQAATREARNDLRRTRHRRRGLRRAQFAAQAGQDRPLRASAAILDPRLFTLPLVFQRGRSKGLAATYQFTFTGREPAEATVVIRDRTL